MRHPRARPLRETNRIGRSWRAVPVWECARAVGSGPDANVRSPMLAGLELNVIQQRGFGDGIVADRVGVLRAHPPPQEVKQIVGIATEGSDATDAPLIQRAVEPGTSQPASSTTRSGCEHYSDWATGSRERSWAGVLHRALELLGIVALDEEAVRTVSFG